MNLQFEVQHRRSSPIAWIVAIVLGIALWIGVDRVLNPPSPPCPTGQTCWDLRAMW